MKKYPKYKDSGVEWIGEIPNHWTLTKIKYVGDYINGYPFKPSDWKDTGRLIIRIQNLTSGNFKENRYDGEIEEQYIVKRGDLLFSWSTTLGLFVWDKEESLLNQHIFKVVLNQIFIKSFFINLFVPVVDYLQSQSHGSTMTHLTKDNFGSVYLPLPVHFEQLQIGEFLDQKTSIIDDLIQKKQRKIELLKEHRISIINQIVTKGLNPNVKMKDSGVKWIGEIPEGWGIKRLRYLGKLQNGISKDSEYFGFGFPFLNYGDVYNNEVIPQKLKGLVNSSESDWEKYSVLEGDVFFTRTSESIDDIGVSSVCMTTIPNCVFSGFIIRFRKETKLLSKEFSKYYFKSYFCKVFIENSMDIVTRTSLSQGILKSLPVLLPPLPEQQQIIRYLDQKTQEIDTTITLENKKIDLLKEYRKSLISEVVTGKIDVRKN